ncbi:acyl-CoA dehydrogenase family protein [Streptacidiphilus sp. P02-A3a]|uniref:acyl-CoA dehydrogenase family protein n=1 Tax=Streptacidiphilus sp. P02-A3a TaxID=2704468 RepID=UPI0015F7F15F|nr:acyl-CoA dehydrogenase family protein [Streptacidiphilus sp. P02-A3a]QMU69885.1 acyl-CoA dehydrogenase [Streptacidiphilus sp. P02-A3a]
MRFRIAEDDAALARAVAELLAKEAPPEVVRAGWPGGRIERVDAVWRRLAGLGVTGVLVPEATSGPDPDPDLGRGLGHELGLGLDENALVPLLRELGRSALPVPVVETVAVGAPLLAAVAAPDLGAVLTGRLRLTASLATDATDAADAAAPVPFGARADLFVLRAGATLRLYRRAELRIEPVASVDGSRGLARITAPAAGGLPLAESPAAVDRAWQRGVLGTAAVLLGLSERMVELTVGHVKERHQFGAPVGSFQAVKHALADAHLAVRFAGPAVLAAGAAQAGGDPAAPVATSLAKVLASDAARLVARTAIQCHGAIGYTTEYDLHLYAKRAWALAAAWGDPADHRDRLAQALAL